MPENKLNILYHFRVRGSGAEGVHIAGIVNGFRALGHKVSLISPTNADPTAESSPVKGSGSLVSARTFVLNRLADVLPQPFFEIVELCYNLFAIIRLWRGVKNGNVDFIYERYAFFNLAGAFISQRKNIPLVVEVNELSGHRRIRGQFFVHLCSAIEKYVLRRADVVVTVSDFLNKEVSGKVKSQKTKIVTIPNGVPLAWLQREISLNDVVILRAKYNLQGKKIICFVGGLVYWHNFELLLKAVKATHDKVGNVVMVFVGDGPLKGYIQAKADQLAFPPESLLFVGKVPHADIPFYLKMVDIAVIPETNDFRSPIKMFEYMGLGLPVVAPDKPAIKVAITHEQTGLLFEPKNYISMACNLLKVINEPTLAVHLGKNARNSVLKAFLWENHAEQILKKYNSILSGLDR